MSDSRRDAPGYGQHPMPELVERDGSPGSPDPAPAPVEPAPRKRRRKGPR